MKIIQEQTQNHQGVLNLLLMIKTQVIQLYKYIQLKDVVALQLDRV